MPLFGFLSESPHPLDFGRLMAHGLAQTTADTTMAAEARIDDLAACWAAGLCLEDSVLVAVQGEPLWTQSGEPASPAAILAEYRRRGSAVVDSLCGRLAIAILDARERRAVLAVDSMGIGRMTYGVRGSLLVFSSSAKAVATAPGIEAPLNNQAIFDYLLLHMVPAPDTIFQGVHKLRPGTCATFERGRLAIRPCWSPSFQESGDASFEALGEELKSSLRTAVRSCRPGGSTGAFLSGGLDSSSVVGILSEVGPRPTRTFSIGFGYPEYDELAYARIANQQFGCEGHEYSISGADIAATFPRVARAFDEPFGNSSALPVYHCARLAREHGVDHLLAGDGGDELFAGNSRYAEQQVFERYRYAPVLLRRGLLEPLLGAWPDPLAFRLVRRARGYIEKANTPLPIRLESWNIIHQAGAAALLHADFLASVDAQAPLRRMQEVWNAAPCGSTLNRMLYYDWQYTLSDNDLRKVETMSGLAGVRVSYPMLHPKVIDLSMRVPPQLKMPGMKLRHFYKHAVRGFLPDAIIEKKKHGFGLPFGLWLAEYPVLRTLVFGNLESLRSRRIVRPDFIDRLLGLHQSDDASYYGVFVWVLAMLEQWMQEHRLQPAV